MKLILPALVFVSLSLSTFSDSVSLPAVADVFIGETNPNNNAVPDGTVC